MGIIKKTFKDLNLRSNIINTLLKSNKFALKAFNRLLYNCKLYGLLIARFVFIF